jgi:Xaa-Pro aminopeptidase
MPRLVCILVSIALATALPSQTRSQRFFEWSKMTFEAKEYAARRAGMMTLLKNSGGGILLVPSAEGRSDGGTFRQRAEFLYLTGLELPRSILAIDSDKNQVVLFAPPSDRRFANASRRNDFPGRPLAVDPELAKRSGIAHIRTSSGFAKTMARWAKANRKFAIAHVRGRGLPPTTPQLWSSRNDVSPLYAWFKSNYPALAIRSAFDAIAAQRMIKSPAEIAVLRRACAITAAGIRAAAARIRPGIDERTLEGALEAKFKAGGAQRTAFASIIKSGPNSLWPWRILAAHYDRRNRKMVAGDLVIFDVGCELHHYASDVGRTFPVSGKFSDRQRELVQMATAVSDTILAAVKPGKTLRELQAIGRAAIPRKERRFMQAGLFFGHHVGLAVGDPNHPGARLAPGMVFTVEPWYYNHDEGVAVFVEDVVLVTKSGCEILTAGLPRETKELEAMVGTDRR